MKVLVANRGEIAVRVLRTLEDMGIASVAVYTDVDAQAQHVWLADEAVALGEPSAYLDRSAILNACKITGATAIHPGYGFLSQNAAFVGECEAAGITFIGPGPKAMKLLGDKSASRALAEDVGVPVIPGAQSCEDADAAAREAKRLSFPVLLKAAGGGGGKGMRRVDTPAQIPDAFDAAKREAMAAFADDRMLVEKYIHPARHIEVQVLGDGTRAVVLGERECSLQRRYQKVIEEAPGSTLSEETRAAVFASAKTLVEAAGYANAGTVEFLVGPDGEHYFLEVNTRLQVEHPVTESLIGLDIVKCQIEIAHGGALPEVPTPRGHAIEARLNAEDAYKGYLPQSGEVAMLQWPQIPGVRIDSGVLEGSVISPHYDSMIAKVIACGATREQARCRLIQALEQSVVLGLQTNQSFLLEVLRRDFFREGETYTTTLEAESFRAPELPENVVDLARQRLAPTGSADGSRDADAYSPWQTLRGFRIGET